MDTTKFRTQYILCANSLEIMGAEVLCRNVSSLRFDDADFMLEHDREALRFAYKFSKATGYRAQCNVEPTSIIGGVKSLLEFADRSVVVELVERHEPRYDSHLFCSLVDGCRRIMKAGYRLAMDDVTPTDLEIELIQILKPNFLKVDGRQSLERVKKHAPGGYLIAERLESEGQAELAKRLGVRELQGFWCDSILAERVNTSIRSVLC